MAEMKLDFKNKILPFLLRYFAIIIWIIQLTFVSYLIAISRGESKFIIAMNWFIYSGLLMLLLSITSLIRFLKTNERTYLISIIINLSFIYNLKIICFGVFWDFLLL
jgi:hypothetical protein